MSALPVETLTEDDVVILLAPVVLEALMRTVTHLPPGTPLVLHARSTDDAVVEATSVLRAVPTALAKSKLRERDPRAKPQRRGTPGAPVPPHPSHPRRDRRAAVRLAQHREVVGHLDLPQARGVMPE